MSGQASAKKLVFQAVKLNAEIERRVLTNDEFGRLVNVPEKTVRRWRAGETQPQKRYVRRLAEALDRDPFWFYEEPEEAAA